MKAIITSLLIAGTAGFASGQGSLTQYTSNSQVKYYASNNGTFFQNPLPNSTGGYFVPKDSLVSAIFAMCPIVMGEDINGQLKGAIAKYQTSDFSPGPIATDYASTDYTNAWSFSIWEMTKAAVDYHLAHWMEQGYVMPALVASWPGNGNTANGESLHLAPFYDQNNDDHYDPDHGDYPLIPGDKATFVIVNDARAVHPSGTDPMQLEMHLMFYQFENPSDLALTQTTFIRTTLYNRGVITLNNLRFGHIIDFDLGNPTDDYIGTNTALQMAYVYNGDLNDESFSGNTGYGINPPAVGVISLDGGLTSNVPVQAISFPNTASQYNNVLNGFDPSGNPFLDNLGSPTTYIFNEAGASGWNEITESNPSGDRISATGHAVQNFLPGDKLVYNHAVVYARSSEGSIFSSVDSLFDVAGYIQDFYDNSIATLGVNEFNLSAALDFTIYPNPANSSIHINGLDSGTYRIVNPEGKEILAGNLESPIIQVDSLKNGFYVLEITSGGKRNRKSFVKE